MTVESDRRPPPPAVGLPRTSVRVLLVEDDPVARELFAAQLREDAQGDFLLTAVDSLAGAVRTLGEDSFDAIVLSLVLTDSHGLDALGLLHLEAGDVPVIVLTSLDDEALAVEALGKGAQDYLVKGELSSRLVARSLRYAIERQRLMSELRGLSLLDDLTGLYNRRGFMTLAEQQLRMAERLRRGIGLIVADLDFFKGINDSHGHLEGDRALQTVSQVLLDTFRGSDLIARFGGDEFVVLAIQQTRAGLDTATARLRENLEIENRARDGDYELSLSLGVAWSEVPRGVPVEELLRQADQKLYAEKRRR